MFSMLSRSTAPFKVNDNVCVIDTFEGVEGVTFGGYYDVNLFSPLIGVVGHHLSRDGYCNILCKNDEGEISTIGKTKAFNLQQGARLTIVNEKVVYNSIQDGYLNSVWVTKKDGKFTKVSFPYPIQSVDQSGTRFCVISYLDLKKFADEYSFASEFKELIGSKELLLFENFEMVKKISISELGLGIRDTDGVYFNHFTYSPTSKFLLGLVRNATTKKSRFIRINLDTMTHSLSANFSVISHYCFIDDYAVVYWGSHHQKYGYYNFNWKTGEISQIPELATLQDGHPSIMDRSLIADTYPDRFRYSKILVYDLEYEKCNLIGQFHQPLKFFGANRCDLHPVWIDHKTLSIDSAHTGNRRMYMVQIIGAL